jgi:hypothetical protein
MTSSTTAPVTSRSSTAPLGPTRVNSVAAIAEPNWTEAIPPTTSAGEGARARSPTFAEVVGASATIAIVERSRRAIVVAPTLIGRPDPTG